MKQFAFVLSLALLFALPLSAQDKAPKRKAEKDLASATIDVNSMRCGMCVTKITKALKSVKGVKEAEVDLDAKVAKVRYDDTKVTLAKLETAITKAGYNANEQNADEKAYEKLPACCK